MAILAAADYPAIRASLDVGLTDTQLTDVTIGLSIYKDAADQDVLELDPEAESRTGEDANRIKRAAIFFCAARLAPAVVRITSLSVQTGDVSYQRRTFDPERRAAELQQLAQAEINEVLLPGEEAPGRPTMFAVAGGVRGQ